MGFTQKECNHINVLKHPQTARLKIAAIIIGYHTMILFNLTDINHAKTIISYM